MQPATLRVDAPIEFVKRIVETDGLQPHFRISHSRVIKWASYSPNHTVGKIPYLRRKKLSVFRFHPHFENVANGAQITVSAETNYFFYKNKWILYLLGLTMCGVGILFPVFGFRLMERRVDSIITDICNSIIASCSPGQNI